MMHFFCLLLAGTVRAASSADPRPATDDLLKAVNSGSDLLRREKSVPENMGIHFKDHTASQDGEKAQRTSTGKKSFSLTETQLAHAQALGKAIARQPKHEQKRMMNILDGIVATSKARQREHEAAGGTGSMSLAEVKKRRLEAIASLDPVPKWQRRPIKGATKESLREASAGYPKSMMQEAEKWQKNAARHPPNALSEYWKRQNLSSFYSPTHYTQGSPELPPDLSAFEKDNSQGNPEMGEYFGPFRLDYSRHVVDLEGWNFCVSSPASKPGLGNVMVGHDNFVMDASNSFIVGTHNTARGDGDAVVGGQDNEAEGTGDSAIGGEDNIVGGEYSVGAGGYRNEAQGFYDVTSGGTQNVAQGNYAVTSGGQNNFAAGIASSITGGKGNEAVGTLTAILGGAGNKAVGKESTVVGGVGYDADQKLVSLWHEMDDQDIATVASMDFSKSNHATAAWAQKLDDDYM